MTTDKNLTLKAEKREVFGKDLKDIRKEGRLPAVFYGPKTKNISIFVSETDFIRIWKKAGESTLINLEIDGTMTPVLIYKVELDVILNEPTHIDFYAPDLSKEITTSVPLVFEGEAPAIKMGGSLVKVLHELEISAMAKDLMHEIKVDLNKLKTFDDKITIGDLGLPEGVTPTLSEDEVVAVVSEAKEVVEEEVPSAEQVEVVGEKKEEEEIEE